MTNYAILNTAKYPVCSENLETWVNSLKAALTSEYPIIQKFIDYVDEALNWAEKTLTVEEHDIELLWESIIDFREVVIGQLRAMSFNSTDMRDCDCAHTCIECLKKVM